jgi:thiamine-monophosphate kinase
MGEFDLIARYFTRPVARAPLGVGDDCALVRVRAGYELAVSTDMLIEGRHFLPGANAELLGHKALAVNLSDLAACGAQPLAFTLSLALPEANEAWLAGFSRGLFALADAHHIELVGGDTTKSVVATGGVAGGQLRVAPGPICISITVLGELPERAALLRSGAQVGDDVWVSGTLGDARLALGHYLGEWVLDERDLALVAPRMHAPTPRVALGMALRGIATSAIDVSDGFLGDLRHVLKQSGVGAEINVDALPVSALLGSQNPARARACALSGGDDYELIFTAPPAAKESIKNIAKLLNVTLSSAGLIRKKSDLILRDAAGQIVPATLRGFDHFA